MAIETILVGIDESIVIDVKQIAVYLNESDLDPATSIGQSLIYRSLDIIGDLDGSNKDFEINEAYTGEPDVIYNGRILVRNHSKGYTRTGNIVTLWEAPLVDNSVVIKANVLST